MPLLALQCLNHHQSEQYIHTLQDKGCRTLLCECGETFAPVLSVGTGLCWLEEGRPMTMYNMGDQPVTVRSHAEHREQMKKHQVALAGTKVGQKGCWI